MAKNIILRLDKDEASPVVADLLKKGVLHKVSQTDASDLLRELINEGIPEDEARYYIDALQRGDEVFTVHTRETQTETAVEIMNRYATTELNEVELETLPIPLQKDAHGVWYVIGARVPLSVLLEDYHNGAEADDLALSYPTLHLEDIHAVLSYYLKHRDVLDTYLREQERRTEQQRLETLQRFPQANLRARLLARVQ